MYIFVLHGFTAQAPPRGLSPECKAQSRYLAVLLHRDQAAASLQHLLARMRHFALWSSQTPLFSLLLFVAHFKRVLNKHEWFATAFVVTSHCFYATR